MGALEDLIQRNPNVNQSASTKTSRTNVLNPTGRKLSDPYKAIEDALLPNFQNNDSNKFYADLTKRLLSNNTKPFINIAETPEPQKQLTSWEKYKQNNPNTPDLLKPIGYALETPYRIPFLNRLLTSAAKTAGGGEEAIATNAPGTQYSDNSGKILNAVADIVGAGVGMVNAPQYAGLNQIGNVAENGALKALDKLGINIATKEGTKAAGNILPYIGQAAVKGVRGGAEMGSLGAMQANTEGAGLKDTAMAGLENAGMGFAFGVGSKVLPDVVKSAFPSRKTTYESIQLPQPEVAATKQQIQDPILKPGKYSVKNTALENAQNEYNSAIEKIQNYTGHNKLTDDEILNASVDLNIDIFKIIDEMQKAEQGVNVATIGNNAKWKNVVGLQDNIKPLRNNAEIKPTINEMIQGNTNVPTSNLNTLNPSIGATDRLHSISQIVSSKPEKQPLTLDNVKNKLERFYTRAIDTNQPLKKVGENTYIKATNSKNVGGTVDYILQNGLVDRQGNKIGESLKDIVKDITKNQENDFMNYVLQKHNVDRAREGKPVYADFTPEQSQKASQLIEKQHPEYKVLNDRLVKFINTFENEWGNKSGLISDDLWNELQSTYKNYVPTHRSFTEMEQGVNQTNGKGFVDQSTPLKKATGSERDVINPTENIMSLVNRTVRTARYNEVGQELLNAIRKEPQRLANLAEIIPYGVEMNPNVNNVVTVLEKGKPVNIQVNDKNLLESLKQINKYTPDEIQNFFKKGTNIYKQLITQKNPVFAIRNIARDVPTYLINSKENNPLKALANLGGAVKDIATNSDTYQQYKGLGGGGSNFFNSDKVYKSAAELTKQNPLQKAIGAIEKFNNVTEAAPRVAEFKNTLKNTGDVNKALYDAADVTTNFSRGGDITKKVDAYVPYLNAGIQGMDKLVRQFKDRPIATVLKGATAITAPTLILNHINKDNEKYKELDSRTKDNYFLIPNGDTFIKIPKSREMGVIFSTLLERTMRQVAGEKDAFKGFKDTFATNFSPSNPVENNILSPLTYNIPVNKDFANRSIVPENMLDRSPKYQYDEFTSEIAKKIGELTNLSPKQIDYLIKSYTGVIGQLSLPAATKRNYASGTPIDKILKPVTSQFVADPLYNNSAISDFYDNYDKLKRSAADKNFIENIPSKTVTDEEKLKNSFAKTSKTITDLSKQAKEAEKQNDAQKLQELRRKIIDAAKESNKLIKR